MSTSAAPGARTGPVRVMAIITIVCGAIFIVAGITTWFMVKSQLNDEKITVSEDADRFGGQRVNGPFTAFAQANVIEKHALAATGGKTYAELAQDDPARQTAMTASFLRASLFTSVVAFGVAALAIVLGILLVLISLSLLALTRAVAPPGLSAGPRAEPLT